MFQHELDSLFHCLRAFRRELALIEQAFMASEDPPIQTLYILRLQKIRAEEIERSLQKMEAEMFSGRASV